MRAPRTALSLLLSVAAAASARETVRVRSSTFAFERLASLRDGLARYCPDVVVEWSRDDAEGSVASLLEGAVDLIIVSRELDGFERELAARLDVGLREHVLALDGPSVIVHPENPVSSLTLGQLERLMTGRVVGWHGVGGLDVSVQLVEEGPSIVAAVASNPGAIGLASMSADRSSVKTVPLQADERSSPIEPTVDSVESGEYPLSRPIRVYSREVNVEAVREVLSFMLLSEGQAAVARAGFASLPADRAIQRELPAREAPEVDLVARVSFPSGGSGLSVEARGSLDGIAERALVGGTEIWVIGHAEASEGRSEPLSRGRAQSVGSYLRGRGVTVSRIEARSVAGPFLSTSAEGGLDDRRADVWLLPRR